ncbi:hypothetical protein PM082_023008 [Marasmius tenuissimus]|nr:hypothetical protein PM082_023008 [Marasmius tenuissimus]
MGSDANTACMRFRLQSSSGYFFPDAARRSAFIKSPGIQITVTICYHVLWPTFRSMCFSFKFWLHFDSCIDGSCKGGQLILGFSPNSRRRGLSDTVGRSETQIKYEYPGVPLKHISSISRQLQ